MYGVKGLSLKSCFWLTTNKKRAALIITHASLLNKSKEDRQTAPQLKPVRARHKKHKKQLESPSLKPNKGSVVILALTNLSNSTTALKHHYVFKTARAQ